MVTRLNLQADHTGTYRGMSSNYSGAGFADMVFNVDAVPAEKFAQWVAAARSTGPELDARAYADLAKPSQAVAPYTYRAVAAGLFGGITRLEFVSTDPSPHTHHAVQRADK